MQAMHPHLDLADQIVRIFGWPALLGALVWIVRKWDKSQVEFKAMREDTIETRRLSVETHGGVHVLQEEIKTQTPILTSMDKSLAVIASKLER